MKAVHGLTRLLGMGVLWAPLGVMGIWAAAYLSSCVDWISGPGKPVRVALKTRGGVTELTAASIAFDFRSGVAFAKEVALFDPHGMPLASSETLIVSLPAPYGPGNRLSVRSVGAWLLAERGPDGSLKLLQYLPEKTEEEAKLPYEVELENATLDLVDRAGVESWNLRLAIDRVRWDGVGESFTASWSMRSKLGSATGSAFRDIESGVGVAVRTDGWDVAPIVDRLAAGPEGREADWLREFQARSARFAGTARLFLPREGEARMWAQGDLRATGVQVAGEYRADTAVFRGTASESKATGVLEATQGEFSGELSGEASYGKTAAVEGRLKAAAPNGETLPVWLRRWLPESLRGKGLAFSGWLAYRQGDGVSLRGDISAESLTYGAESLSQPRGEIRLSGPIFTAVLRTATWRGSGVSGAATADLERKTLSGAAFTGNLDIAKLAGGQISTRLTGSIRLRAGFGGALDAPEATVLADGKSWWKWEDRPAIYLGRFSGVLKVAQGMARLESLGIVGGAGVAFGKGALDLDRRSVEGGLSVRGFDLSSLLPDAQGVGAADLSVSGTWEDPKATGRIEVAGGRFLDRDLPFSVANLSLSKRRVEFRDAAIARGAATAKGRLAFDFETRAVEGEFEASGVRVSDVLGDDFGGTFKLSAGTVRGTLDSPEMAGILEGTDLVAHGFRFDSLAATIRWADQRVDLPHVLLRSGEGRVEGQAEYALKGGQGNASLRVDALDLRRSLPPLPGDTAVAGGVSGTATLRFDSSGLTQLAARGSVAELQINPANLGSGSWSAGYENGKWSAAAELGQIERFVHLEGLSFDPESQRMEGRLVAFGLPLRELVSGIRPYFVPGAVQERAPTVELPASLVAWLDSLDGQMEADVTVSGLLSDPEVSIDEMGLSSISLRQSAAGKLALRARRRQRVWDVFDLRWEHQDAVLTASGRIEEGGAIDLSGSANNIRSEWLGQFVPEVASLRGRANASFVALGAVGKPEILASFDATLLEPDKRETQGGETAFERDPRLVVSLAPIEIKEGKATAEGSFRWLGFKGNLEASFPFQYPLLIPDDQPFAVKLRVPERDLAELKDLWPAIDAKATQGHVSGAVDVTGTRLHWDVDGRIQLMADRVGLEGLQTALRALRMEAVVKSDALRIEVSGESALGGGFIGIVGAPLALLQGSLHDAWDALSESRLDGALEFRDFRLNEDHRELGSLQAGVQGVVRIQGTAAEPYLRTERPLEFKGVRARLPEVLQESQAPSVGPISPRFEIAYRIGDEVSPAEVAGGTGVFRMDGSGAVAGTLDRLVATGDFRLFGGTIRLPNARIAVEEGGSARFQYRGDPASPDARLDVDIAGTTGLTALRFNGVAERYSVRLEMRGNLLEQDALRISARSDPPDLTQDQILALLGQRDLVQSLAPEGIGGGIERRLGAALGFAVPMFLDPYTDRLARELGLEFLTIEYNVFEGSTITAAKSLRKGLVLQYRRQLAEGPDGVLRYDLRLNYRPFGGRGFLRNLYFSLGTDNDRPYRISLEYAIRH